MSSSRRLIAYGSLVAAVVLLLSWFSPTDADTFWHLRTGRFILEDGFPNFDPFSFALDGRAWVVFEWLAQVLLWIALKAGGVAGLVAFKGAVSATAFVLVFLIGRRRPQVAASLALVAVFGARGFFVERPFIFDYAFFAAWLFVLWEKDFSKPATRRDWLLPVSVVLWSNLHGGAAFLGPALLGMALLVERPLWRSWGPLLGASVAAVVIHPYGWGVIEQFWGTLTFPAKELLYEWRRPTTELFGVYGVFFVVTVLSLPMVWKRSRRVAVWMGAVALGAFGMQRNIPFLLLVAVGALTDLSEPLLKKRTEWKDIFVFPTLAFLALFAFWLHTDRVFPQRNFVLLPTMEVPFEGALTFLDREKITGNGFNEYEAGGALIYRSSPERKVFADGRSLEYGPGFLRDVLSWFQPQRWQILDEKWNFQYAIVGRHPSGAYTSRILDVSALWRLVYWDDEAMVYLKVNDQNASVITNYGYSLIEPGRSNHQYIGPILQQPGGADRLLAELERTLSHSPKCANARQLKTFVLASLNRIGPAMESAKAAVRSNPDRAQAYYLKAWVHETAGELRAAETSYREALARIDRRSRQTLGADILNNLGRLREIAGDRKGAISLYERAVKWNPRQGHAVRNLRRLGV